MHWVSAVSKLSLAKSRMSRKLMISKTPSRGARTRLRGIQLGRRCPWCFYLELNAVNILWVNNVRSTSSSGLWNFSSLNNYAKQFSASKSFHQLAWVFVLFSLKNLFWCWLGDKYKHYTYITWLITKTTTHIDNRQSVSHGQPEGNLESLHWNREF